MIKGNFGGSVKYKYDEDAMTATLILQLKRTKSEVLALDFEDFIDTYKVFYINSLNEYEASKSKG